LSRQCGILNILQPYRPPWPVTGIALLLYTTIFNAWDKNESFKKKLNPWIHVIAEGNNETVQLYRDYIKETEGFHSQNSVLDFITAHLKMLLPLENYYLKHRDPRRQNMWIESPFAEHKEIIFPYKET
jgi:hypothetical protein